MRPAPALLVLPAVLLVVAVLIYPIAYGLYLSLFDYVMTMSPDLTFVGLSNYRKLFADESFRNSLAVTGRFTAMTVALEFIIGLGDRPPAHPGVSLHAPSSAPSSCSR
jgi:multiple sugar transport system permease protein